MPDPSPASRRSRAATTLRCGRAELVAVLCHFAGVCPPAGPSAEAMLAHLLDRLEDVPIGDPATRGDLTDAVTHPGPGAAELIPPIPASTLTAAAFLTDQLAALPPAGARVVAGEAGLDQPTAMAAAVSVLAERDRAEPHTPAIGPFPDPAGEPAPATPRGERAEQILAALSGEHPADWTELTVAALRRGVASYLAAVGDAFLRTSERNPTQRHWRETDTGAARVCVPVPGAGSPLEAHLAPDTRRNHPPAVCLFAPERPVPAAPCGWEVGWADATGHFCRYDGDGESSPGAARYAACLILDTLLADPGRVRMRLPGELLIPRPGNVGSRDARLVTLEDLLVAIMNEHRIEQRHGHVGAWRTLPHHGPDGGLEGVVAVLFEHLCLPTPAPGDPANAAEVDTPVFTEFLTRQALTPLARRYLAGLADPDPDAAPLAVRHAAAMQAVLTDTGGGESAWLACEVPTRAGLSPSRLTDIATLEPYFTPDDDHAEPV
jgi:hypothetical protein